MRPNRAFRPTLTTSDALERREVLSISWLTSQLSQSVISLTDSNGNIWYPTDGKSLIADLNLIQSQGGTITDLSIKGHGAPNFIYLNDDPANGDNLLLLTGSGHLVIGNTDITGLLQSVAGPQTQINLGGCSTGPLAQGVSAVLNNGAIVTGNTWTYGLGIPYTSIVIGNFVSYKNGNVYTPPSTAPYVPPSSIGY